MIQREDDTLPEDKPKKKKQVDQSEALSQLYEYVIWCGNAINQLNATVAQIQQQITPYPPYQEIERTPPEEPNTPTFSKRSVKPIIDEEPEKKERPPWYKQKGIVFAIILAILMLYFIYLFYMKSTGHAVSIGGFKL